MRKLVLTVAALAVTLAACKKEQPAAPAEAARQEQAAAEPAPAEPTPAAAEEEEPQPVKVDAALLKKYAAYQREFIDVVRAYAQKVNKELEATDQNSTTQVLGAVSKVGKLTEAMDQKEQELLVKHGLTGEQVDAARDLVLQVIQGRMMIKSAGPDGTEQIVAQARAQLKNAPPEQRAEMEAEIAKMEDTFKRITNAQDARDRYGDEAVDAVLAQEGEFQKLQTESMSLLAEQK